MWLDYDLLNEALFGDNASDYRSKKEITDAMLAVLISREVFVLYLRFGKRNQLTLREAGKVVGVTSERIRQVESKALRKLRGYFWDAKAQAKETQEPTL